MMQPVYLDTAATGILSQDAIEAGKQFDDLLNSEPSVAFYTFLERIYPTLQSNLAQFIGVDEDRMSLVPNFSYAFSMLLASLKPHMSKVLVFSTDYPSLVLPLQLQGFDLHKLPAHNGFSWSLEVIENAITEHDIEILAISHVQYNTGFKADLKAISKICEAHGVLLLVDATQSLGALDFHFDGSGIDVFIASNYKWMNAGFGSAVMCFKNGFLERFNPAIAGYGSLVAEGGQMVYKPSASSYFPGHMSLNSLLTLNQAVKEKLGLDMNQVDRNNLQMAERFTRAMVDLPFELIGPYSMENRSAIVVIKSDQALHEHLLSHGIRTTFRNNTTRISFHYTNTSEDLCRLVDALQRFSNK